MSYKLNIFTCCDGTYKDFIPIFILSNLFHNENCHVEVGMDVSHKNIEESLKILQKHYPNKFSTYVINFHNKKINGKTFQYIPNTVRFFTPPKIKSDYVYISDIDIINLEKNICDIHISNMKKTNLPYSNIVRKNSKRLSGLHFTPYENYYPVPNFENLLNLGKMNDEMFLYELVKKRYPNFNTSETYRPVHGIHISPNRHPEGKDGRPGWGLPKWKKEWINFRNDKIFLKVEPTLTNYIKDKIKIIDNYYK